MKYGWLSISILLLFSVLTAWALPAAATDSGDGIQWLPYAEGLQRGEDENKKVFLVFNADWCRYCLKMEKETFQNPTVVSYVNRHFVPISVNSDKEQTIAAKFNVRGLPSTFFISEDGEPIANRPGYIDPDEMLKILKFIGTDSYLSMSFKDFLEGQP